MKPDRQIQQNVIAELKCKPSVNELLTDVQSFARTENNYGASSRVTAKNSINS